MPQKRKSEHIQEGYESRGVSEKEAERAPGPPPTRTVQATAKLSYRIRYFAGSFKKPKSGVYGEALISLAPFYIGGSLAHECQRLYHRPTPFQRRPVDATSTDRMVDSYLKAAPLA